MKTVKKELQVKEIKKRTGSPFFLATLFIPEMLWTTRMPDLEVVLNKYVKYKAGNATRVFLLPSSWDAKYNNWAREIFLRYNNGKFILPPDCVANTMGLYINPEWEEQVIERIQMVVRRKIMLIISLWDNCSFRQKRPGFWSDNFLNPKNNKINTSSHNHSYYKYATEQSSQMETTGKIVEALTEYMLDVIHDNLTPRERRFIAFETCNEGQSGTAWHLRMKAVIDETWGNTCPRWRRFTSIQRDVPHSIGKNFTPVIHQVGNMKSYLDNVLDVWSGYGISTDGWHEEGPCSPVPIPGHRAKKLLKRAYKDEQVLMEMLYGHRHIHQRVPGSPFNTTWKQKYYDHSVINWTAMRKMGRTLLRLTK